VPILEFRCRFISPFHTAGERYSNVNVCAPYVLGSTLRGAILGQTIRRRCPEEAFAQLLSDNPAYHDRCPGPCGAQLLFTEQTRFSFGEFPEDARTRIFRSRVAIDRERFSVAEGALLTFDAVPGERDQDREAPDSRFTFEVEVPSGDLVGLVTEAASWAGDAGIGAFRNQGYGRFVVEKHEEKPDEPTEPGWPENEEVVLEVRSPFVLGAHQFGPDAFLQGLSCRFDEDWCEAHFGGAAIQQVHLGYIGRWCYEDGKRHVRAVALPGSALKVTFRQPVSAGDASRILRGLGEWNHMGFGWWRHLPPDDPS